jgi:hypothetical protein
MKIEAMFAALLLALATVTACQPAGNTSSLRRGAGNVPDDDGTPSDPSSPTENPKTGETPPAPAPTTKPTGGTPAKPLDPNGFTAKIAPILDAQGCTECHHAGRPIDLTKYPFMAGDDKDIADRLTKSLGTTMPPAPRDRAPSSVTDAIAAWRAAGMKP